MFGTSWRMPRTRVSKSAAMRPVIAGRGGVVEAVETGRTGRRAGSAAGRATARRRPGCAARAPAAPSARSRPGAAPVRRSGRRSPVPADRLERVADLEDHVLALAEDDGVDEVGERLGVEDDRAAGDDERIGRRPLGRGQADAGEVEHLEHVRRRPARSRGSGRATSKSRSGRRVSRLQSGTPARAQLGREVDVGREAALGQAVGPSLRTS